MPSRLVVGDGVFVWSPAHVHELSRHRALTSLIACGYLRFCARWFSFLSLEACSCVGFVVFLSVAQFFLSAVRRLNSMSHLLSLSFIADIEGDHSARVRECECVCVCECVFLCSRVRTFDALLFWN